MDEKSKAEKRAKGRLLLQQYQKTAKDGKSSPSPKNTSAHCSPPKLESKQNQMLADNEYQRNGHSENELNKVSDGNDQSKGASNFFTFNKEDSPAEQFFDSIRPSPQQSSPDHSDRGDVAPQEISSLTSYNVYTAADRLKDDKSYECSTSSRSSRSDDETLKRLLEGHLSGDVSAKEQYEKKVLEANEKVVYLQNDMKKMVLELENLRNHQLPLEQKVQVLLETIEMLVGEKSELQQELSKVKEEHFIDKSKNKEVSSKLKVSEETVGKLGNELSEIYEAREQHNTILKKLERSLADANNSAEMYRKEVQESKEEITLLKLKLEQIGNHTQEMKKHLDEKDKQLSMAEMRLAQHGAGGIPTRAEVNKVEDLEKECTRLNSEIAKMEKEKTDIVNQYQQYIDTVNSQVQLVNQQYESCLISKNQLLTREESLVKHISELEKKVQKEHQAGPSLTETNSKLNQELKEANTKITELSSSISEKNEEINRLNAALEETYTKLSSAELSLETLEVPDARKLQAAIESDRVAATRAVQQNTQLKQHVIELQEAVVRLNNEKLELTEKWQHSEYVLSELNRELKKYKGKQDVEFRDAVAQCAVSFFSDQGTQANIDDTDIPISVEHVTPEAVGLLERKLKKTMNDYANLYDEKQRLEHLVLHLQSETETIGEYVTLYQNQRSLLQERAKERDRQMVALAKEREELKLKLAEINLLLPQVIQEPGTTPVQSSLPNGVDSEGPANKIKTLLTEIETSNLVSDINLGMQSTFHPCLLCSGKLITI